MTIKEQFQKVKDNWLIVLVIAILLVVSMGGNVVNIATQSMGKSFNAMSDGAYYESSYARDSYYPGNDGDFAPDVTERKIVKTAYLQSEVERKQFDEAYLQFKTTVSNFDAYLLTDNVNEYGKGLSLYHSGSFSIKVSTSDYDNLVADLKEIGEVKSFNENAKDITGSYTDIEIELATERDRLERFKKLLEQSTDVKDQIELTDRIFNQERTVKYYEDRLRNMDQKIDYSTISFTLTEERSAYANTAVVKFSELVNTLVESFNGLLYLFFIVIPWLVVILVIRLIWKVTKRK